MKQSIILLLVLLAVVRSTVEQNLLDQRYENAKVWQLRTIGGAPAMLGAYAPNIVDFSTIFHTVRGVGRFGPGDIALEYDFLVPGLQPLIGYAPVRLFPTWDINETKWVGQDTLQLDYMITIDSGYNPATQSYVFANQVFRFREYIVFNPNSPLINLGYTVQDPGADIMFALTAANLPNEALCGIIFQACNVINASGYNYILDTGFASFADCLAFMVQLPTSQPCPFTLQSNTTGCRQLHAFSSFFLPNIHCSHVKPLSPVCRAQCLPQCSNCDANAKCIASFPNVPTSFGVVYSCKCNNGYIGNGTTCTPLACSNKGNCPASAGSYSCANPGNLCKCLDSFTSQPSLMGVDNSLCICPLGSTVFWVNKVPVCLPEGRCLDDSKRYMCNIQNYNQIKCLAQNNSFNTLSLCTCNYGYNGGKEYPCVCNGRQEWSNKMAGQICINATECTENWHCSNGKVCVGATALTIGACVNSVKRDFTS